MKSRRANFLLLLAAAVTFSAAASDLRVKMVPLRRAVPLVFHALTNQNANGPIFSVTRLDFLLSDFALRRRDGTWLEKTNQQAFLSLGEGQDDFTLEQIPPGEYDRVRFYVGLTPKLNHSDPAKYPANHPLNPNRNGLHWGWQNGYVFLAIEGHWREAEINAKLNNGYSFHLGNDWSLMTVELPVALDVKNATTLQLALNVDEILGEKSALHFTEANSSTHSRQGDELAVQLCENVKRSFSVYLHQGEQTLSENSKRKTQNLKLPANPLAAAATKPYRFTFSAQFPLPELPKDNPLTEEGVELGEHLFNETLLSINNRQSCASCHRAEAALADPGKRFNSGAEGQMGTRNAMPLFNLAWKKSFFWDGRAATLREQVLQPIQNPIEMHETLDRAVAKLAASLKYEALFARAFGSGAITTARLAQALEQFLLAQLSYDSKFDRAMDGRAELTEEEKRGFELFSTEYDPRREQFGADCFHCHGGPFFTTHGFANNGLDFGDDDPGRFAVTGQAGDKGRFSVPSLRNVELTGPYMHDGRFQTLEEVVAHYNSSVKQSATLDPNLAKHPTSGLSLSAADQKALVAFLKTLTDGKPSLSRSKPAGLGP